ncbi:hypothetical protein BT93_L1722 [Corymbia citriodora subsp. variegata]|uniref:Uncharacterized protein n=1 Tax=Corymbia citriodora subsp. variegata TaxID=360336 RepID=A0A8T0CLY0_CORYI|nr:hypothetical protein BT93_L1722 [Corymbia citriodora subsp. variegata]
MPKLTNNLHQVVPTQELVAVNSLHLPVEVMHEHMSFSFRRPSSRTAHHRPLFLGVAAQIARRGSHSHRGKWCGRRS